MTKQNKSEVIQSKTSIPEHATELNASKTQKTASNIEVNSKTTQNTEPTDKQSTQNNPIWTYDDGKRLYGIKDWGADYFDVNADGHVVAQLPIHNHTRTQNDTNTQANTSPNTNSTNEGSSHKTFTPVALIDIIEGMQERGLDMPCILRIENLLDDRIKALNEAFARAIKLNHYQNHYRGVFPIKVNQQAHVIEEIASFGQRYHHGFEAGSKAELIIAMAKLLDNDSLIVCNGYKDAEFVDLGLYAKQMGIRCFFVLETPSELPIILARAQALDIEPLIGVRIRPTVCVDGHWSADSGDRSIFGLSTGGLMQVVKQLKEANMMHCLQLLHCHIGSQVPNIRNIRAGVLEACRYYAGLIEAGAPMGYIDLGGGLGVDYEGSKSNNTHSMNYQLDEYCVNVVETICECFNTQNIAHPVIITESGRATVAYSSMLLFNVLDVRDHRPMGLPKNLPDDCHDKLKNLWLVNQQVTEKNYQECYNDAIYYRDEIRDLFLRGQTSLNERALADNLALAVLEKVATFIRVDARVPEELENLPELLSDTYYGNFSLFQSLPDIWAIDQLLPVMPIHRLDEAPTREAVIADITCDCDGKINQFATPEGMRRTIPLHALKEGEEYYLGVFLVGAYQETLGDLHNLFGDTNVVSVHIKPDGSFDFVREFEGDSIADVLSYVEYKPKDMIEDFRKRAENAVKKGHITAKKRREMMKAFKDSLDGYTYFEDA